jgi:hypothetical protein
MIKDLLEYTRTRLGKRIPVTPLAYDVGQVCEAAHDEVQAAHPTVSSTWRWTATCAPRSTLPG